MHKAKLFKNGESQAVRLPKQFRFEGSEVYIKKEGSKVILLPVDDTIDQLWATLDNFSEDFMQERNQPDDYDQREMM